MKILYLHNAEFDSQMANSLQVKAMCTALAETGNKVTLSLIEKSNAMNENLHTHYPFKIHFRKRLFSSQKLDKYLNSASIRNTIKEVNPDILYLRNPLLLKQSMASGKPVIIELHNNLLHLGSGLLNNHWTHYLIKVARSPQIIRVVCISQALSNFWINKGLPEDKVITAHDAVNEKMFFASASLSKPELRKKLSLPMDKIIVTYSGRLYTDRRISSILNIARNFKELLFLIIGGPEEQSNYYKNLAIRDNIANVKFTGQVPHNIVPEYLHASDILLALWSSEVKTINYCSPLKVFEYMAAEKIIIAHGFPTIKEILVHKKNALLAEPDSEEDLKFQLSEAISLGNQSHMAIQAKQDVLERYTWKKRVETIFNGIN